MNIDRLTPIVGVVADVATLGKLEFQMAGEKYLTAVIDAAGCLPFIVPSLADRLNVADIVTRLDGVLFTGHQSNIAPHHYGENEYLGDGPLDPHRDALTLKLARTAVDAGVPVLGICRGFQEINVAYGGALLQKIHDTEGFNDHREVDDAAQETQYAPAHGVQFVESGYLASLFGVSEARVNSLHGQGIQRLGEGLSVEARAEDGLIEAFSVTDAETFAVGVQWHPEWKATENLMSRALFGAFGDACRRRAAQRKQP